MTAKHRVVLFVFVDGVFCSVFGLQVACQADFLFSPLWRHKFAEGAKGATELPVQSPAEELLFPQQLLPVFHLKWLIAFMCQIQG